MLTLQWDPEPKMVMVYWDDATNLATWHSKEEIESHWEGNPQRCINLGYLIARDGTGALYVAARKGAYNEEADAWGLIERLPIGMVTKIMYLETGLEEPIQWAKSG